MRFITMTRTIAIFMAAMARRIFPPRQREVSPSVGNASQPTRATNGAMPLYGTGRICHLHPQNNKTTKSKKKLLVWWHPACSIGHRFGRWL
ncbi:hypothetical protein RHECNPAF_64200112 [Rhizobium etli CNPAF512]|nr:hypothetical protein RHECNPAF_64200112 [Rhizobium etli CNPAF512]